MGYGGMPRKKKDEFDWDNADLADLEKEPEGSGTISGSTPDNKGKDKNDRGKSQKVKRKLPFVIEDDPRQHYKGQNCRRSGFLMRAI